MKKKYSIDLEISTGPKGSSLVSLEFDKEDSKNIRKVVKKTNFTTKELLYQRKGLKFKTKKEPTLDELLMAAYLARQLIKYIEEIEREKLLKKVTKAIDKSNESTFERKMKDLKFKQQYIKINKRNK